ncbi:hypothetical protein GCM10011531_07230 [Aquaticitalea lipolytica]|uniref:Uncharacterized protein n=1 Tax=Aquaticitalea lipolytica TaxID=1247562 RepID=A0A8J2TLQ5_9FLAO|nr:hypothetical protein [Aquaticitalea lipolytica]GFZ79849.1 hypothetical protein GCM10011531_07230 [Aquaticitalea lipolytica]
MVHLIDKYKQERESVLIQENIQSSFYRFISKEPINYTLAGQEELANRGFKGETLSDSEIKILTSSSNKKNQIDNNIFKLIGLFLASSTSQELKKIVETKFDSSSMENQYILYKAFPLLFKERMANSAKGNNYSVIRHIFGEQINEEELKETINAMVISSLGLQELIILEDYIKQDIATTYNNLQPLDLVKQVIDNFPEAIKQIKSRRKGKDVFQFKDEYDVQDILYIMLKPIFPKMKAEDPIEKVGSTSTKIDLILREEKILIEVKMIKENDNDESKFIKQLKEDIQSYYVCQWMKHLVCFIYDPQDKTKDRTNFYDLNGIQTINGKTFEVDVIVLK